MNSHVAPDTMDAYVAGGLDLEQRDAVEHHASECPACARGLAMAEFSWKVYRRIRTLLFDEDENDLKGDVNGSAADNVKNLNCCSEQ